MVQVLGKDVGVTGFGLMGFTWARENLLSVEDAVETLKTAADSGLVLWSGGEAYGTPEYNSMTLLKAYFTKYPEDADKITIVIKGGADVETMRPDGSVEGTRRSIENIIAQLGGTKKLDLWSPGRKDADVSLDVTFGAAQEFIDAGKLGGVALSEVREETVHDGAKVAKVELCELELNMYSPDILRNGVAAACAKYDIPVMAYSPMGRGMLAGRYKSADEVSGLLTHFPRFQAAAFEHNYKLSQHVFALAEKKGCTPAQLALAWVRAQSRRDGNPAVIPIPGATTKARVLENSKVVELTEDEVSELAKVVDGFESSGSRYPDYVPSET